MNRSLPISISKIQAFDEDYEAPSSLPAYRQSMHFEKKIYTTDGSRDENSCIPEAGHMPQSALALSSYPLQKSSCKEMNDVYNGCTWKMYHRISAKRNLGRHVSDGSIDSSQIAGSIPREILIVQHYNDHQCTLESSQKPIFPQDSHSFVACNEKDEDHGDVGDDDEAIFFFD